MWRVTTRMARHANGRDVTVDKGQTYNDCRTVVTPNSPNDLPAKSVFLVELKKVLEKLDAALSDYLPSPCNRNL